MTTGFVYLRPLSVVCAGARGPYAAEEAWQRMLAWLAESGMRRTMGCGYGLMLDDSATTSLEDMRYEACIELLSGYEAAVPREFAVKKLSGGAYARIRQPVGTSVNSTISALQKHWVPQNGLVADRTRANIEIYLDDPLTTPVSMQRMDICVPVAMGATTLQNRAA